ncbi:hypothetical protein GPJ56_007475 [Histomonas meleagridis]|uniref:uncharacterized protein n=1 Tax=Histomonas meleagridis TaxID=135588 RepID=UPI003559F810|nr:hypothetical protein GPJ56_007475 [Histomonas meleagridis]KAH0804321.1 hypothetical protein GO595_003151 [Histomonas meleagridis]
MGIEGSIASHIKPLAILGVAPENIKAMACNDKALLIISNSKTIELRKYNNETLTKILSLNPTCCCSTERGWAIGFTNGQLSEFDSDLNLIISYRIPGRSHAHDGEIKQIQENSDFTGKSESYLMSYGSDNTINLWSKNGKHLFSFTPKFNITAVCTSPFYVFLSDDHNQIHTINIETHDIATYTIPNYAKSIIPLGDGFSSLAVLSDGSVTILSSRELVSTFNIPITEGIVYALPLVVEYGTGLITYLTMNKDGKVVLRALEVEIGEIGKNESVFADSVTHTIVLKDGLINAYLRDDLETLSMQYLPEMNLPRERIAKFLMRQ